MTLFLKTRFNTGGFNYTIWGLEVMESYIDTNLYLRDCSINPNLFQ